MFVWCSKRSWGFWLLSAECKSPFKSMLHSKCLSNLLPLGLIIWRRLTCDSQSLVVVSGVPASRPTAAFRSSRQAHFLRRGRASCA